MEASHVKWTVVPGATTVAVRPGGAVGGVSSGGGTACDGALAYAAKNAAKDTRVHLLELPTAFSQAIRRHCACAQFFFTSTSRCPVRSLMHTGRHAATRAPRFERDACKSHKNACVTSRSFLSRATRSKCA